MMGQKLTDAELLVLARRYEDILVKATLGYKEWVALFMEGWADKKGPAKWFCAQTSLGVWALINDDHLDIEKVKWVDETYKD